MSIRLVEFVLKLKTELNLQWTIVFRALLFHSTSRIRKLTEDSRYLFIKRGNDLQITRIWIYFRLNNIVFVIVNTVYAYFFCSAAELNLKPFLKNWRFRTNRVAFEEVENVCPSRVFELQYSTFQTRGESRV